MTDCHIKWGVTTNQLLTAIGQANGGERVSLIVPTVSAVHRLQRRLLELCYENARDSVHSADDEKMYFNSGGWINFVVNPDVDVVRVME